MGKQGIVILLVFGIAATALADTTVYDNEADFLVAIEGGGGFLLEDFDGYVYGGFTGYTLQLGPQDGYAGLISCDPSSDYLWSGDGNMSTQSATSKLHVDFNGEPTYSTAGWFFPTDISGYYMAGEGIDIELSNGFEYHFDPPNGTTFRGFVADDPFDWVKIDAPYTSSPAWPTMDHYYIDSPEPASLSLLALGALALLRRR